MRCQTILLFFFCGVIMLAIGRDVTLNDIHASVSFEQMQFEEHQLAIRHLDDEIKRIQDDVTNDANIQKALRVQDELQALALRLEDATLRQAILLDTINRIINGGALSPQESSQYHKEIAALRAVGQGQGRISGNIAAHQGRLASYLKDVPAPDTMTLDCGLRMRLVKGARGVKFYVSEPLTISFYNAIERARATGHALNDEMASENRRMQDAPARRKNDGSSIAPLTLNEARDVARYLTKELGVALTLPTQPHCTVMESTGVIPAACAIWTSDAYPMRMTLAQKASLQRRSRKEGRKIEPQIKEMTPSQQEFARRFRMHYALVWDPNLMLNDAVFAKEISTASYESLGCVLVMPASVGGKLRLNVLKREKELTE